MNVLRMLAVGAIVCVTAIGKAADDPKEKPDNARLLVGKWEVTAAKKELPVGAVLQFSKDSKMKITISEGGMDMNTDAVYKVEADKIHFTLKLDGKEEKKDPLTIKKISETVLILEADRGITFELKRVK
jgi:uncharacterized protein (TIGR03066 family)